jgi:hypothetical protein
MYFDDAVVFDASSLKIERTVSNSNSPGIRVNFYAYLGKSELRMQIDIGYGDSVISAPQKFTIHSKIAELGSFQLMTYPAATAVAEKIEAIISLGMANTRLKDFYDLFIILKNERLNMVEVGESIKSTFETRGTTVGPEVPLGLSTGFATNLAKISSWNAFLAKNRLEPIELTTVIERIRGILNPILPR